MSATRPLVVRPLAPLVTETQCEYRWSSTGRLVWVPLRKTLPRRLVLKPSPVAWSPSEIVAYYARQP